MSKLRTAGLTCAVAAFALSSTPAHAEAGSYVALGDSYSAGTGTKAKVDDCYRSTYGYPALLAADHGLTLNYQACSGATTADVRDKQLGALSSSTNYVTMTIGGNDVGFASVLTECAQPGWMSDCEGAIAGGRAVLTGQLPGRFDTLLGQVKAKAPSARVTLGGYPHIFNGEDCNAATFFSPQEESSLNTATTDLNSLVRSKAGSRGFNYVDPVSSFKGHAVCDDVEWVNGLSNPIEESYHPNRAGNEAYATLFAPGVSVAKRSASPEPRQHAVDQTSPPQQVRRTADGVLAMGLSAPENLEKAKAAGLNPAEITRLNTDLRSSDIGVVEAALDRLKVLDERSS